MPGVDAGVKGRPSSRSGEDPSVQTPRIPSASEEPSRGPEPTRWLPLRDHKVSVHVFWSSYTGPPPPRQNRSSTKAENLHLRWKEHLCRPVESQSQGRMFKCE